MKKAAWLLSVLFFATAGANAYFNGSAGVTTGPDGYRGTDLAVAVGNDSMFLKPGFSTYTSDALDKNYKVFRLRGGMEKDLYTAAAEAGFSQKEAGYQYKYFGADITFSLTPGAGGRARLAGPNARAGSGGGKGVTRIDVGAALRRNVHNSAVGGLSQETGQNEFSLFAGAKVLMARLGASFTGYSYGSDKAVPLLGAVPGLNFALSAFPRSSVNVRADLPGNPLVTPYAAYTATKYKFGVKDSSAYLLGGTIDLNMVAANVAYQIFNNGSGTDSFISIGAGLKF